MKRSSQIGLAAAGVVLVATVWSMTGEEAQENVVYGSVSECLAAAQLSADQCETAFAQATAARLKDAPKFRSQVECEVQYGANGCNTANVGGAQYFIPALAGFMLARGLARAQAQPLLPPTTATCPPGSRQPECQQARSSSSGSSGGSGGYARSRAYSTTSGRGVTAAFAAGARGGSVATTSLSSRGGFGSTARSYSSHSSS